jgi:hypothetical protein
MDFDLVQAQWVLGRFPWDQLPNVAIEALVQGFEGPAILDLASFDRPTLHLLKAEGVDAAFREMGRPSLSRGEAGLRLAREEALRILRGEVSPESGSAGIRDLISRAGYPDVPEGLLQFQVGLYDAEDRRIGGRAYDLRVIELAWDLLNG